MSRNLPPAPDDSAAGIILQMLRWLVFVMDPDDRGLVFVVGCLSWSLRHGGTLTPKQLAAIEDIYSRVVEQWDHGALACENHPLQDVEPEGHP